MGERKAGGDTFHADEDQLAEIDRYASGRARVVVLPPELDISGGDPIERRPSLKAAIEGVEAGEFTGIVVANLKRLTRSRSGHMIWERVEAAGGHVHCARERLDTSTAQGRKIRDYEIANAVAEREEHAERHAERRRKTVEAGVWRQRQVPLGYQFAGPAVDGRCRGQARRLVPSDRADQVRWAFRARADGTPVVTIAARLGLTPSGARQLLRNRIYLGELRDGPNVNVAAHEPLVTVDEFDAAQRDVPRPSRRVDAAPALLAGVVRCAACGHVMTRRNTRALVYGCPAHHSGARCPQPAAITCASLDAYVERIALAELERLSVSAGEGRGVEQAEAAVVAAEAEVAALLKVVTAAGLDDRDFADELRERKAAVDAAHARLRVERERSPALPLAGMTGADVWESLTGHERNQLLRSLLSAVLVRASGRGKRVPLIDRVRVLRHGAEVRLAERRGGRENGAGIVSVWVDVDHPDALRLAASEDHA
jgi:DNA invertase Pin-like site-specific DNA recombinase